MKLVLGLDIGKEVDHSALTAVEVGNNNLQFNLRYTHRFPLGTLYEDIYSALFNYAVAISTDPEERKPILVVDKTGVGNPVVERLGSYEKKGIAIRDLLEIRGIVITGGTKPRGNKIPKNFLISNLRECFERGLIKIGKIGQYELLIDELINFSAHQNLNTGSITHSGLRNDDLVMSLSLALYIARREYKPIILEETQTPVF